MTVYKEISNEERLLLEKEIFNNYKYARKRSAYEARANQLSRFDKNEWNKMVSFFQFKCCKCESVVIGGYPTKDHIIGISLGGTNNIRNLQPLCRECNVGIGYDDTDFRKIWCNKRGIELPEKWRLYV